MSRLDTLMPVFLLGDDLVFPPVELAEDGLLAVGGDLRPDSAGPRLRGRHLPLVLAGRADPLALPRPAIRAARLSPAAIRKSLQRSLRRSAISASRSTTAFERVIDACAKVAAPRSGRDLDHTGDARGLRRAASAAVWPIRPRPGTARNWSAACTASHSARPTSASPCSPGSPTRRRPPSRRSRCS